MEQKISRAHSSQNTTMTKAKSATITFKLKLQTLPSRLLSQSVLSEFSEWRWK